MKYSTTVTIDKSLKDTIALFDSIENYPKWMEGLQSMEIIEGKAGEEGTKSRMHFKMGKRDMEMVETVLKRDLPDLYTTSYESGPVYNIVESHFKAIGDQTEYTTVHEFQFKGFMKLMAWLMPGMFKKQSLKYLNNFKKFAEAS